MNDMLTMPLAVHLFNVDDVEKVQPFHHLVAKLLYLSQRSRQDKQTAFAFLFTRVRNPHTDDYKKLA